MGDCIGDAILFIHKISPAFDKLMPIISEHHENLVFAGDLNVHLDPTMDKKGGKEKQRSEYAERMLQTFEEYSLIDVWRICNPETNRYTWRKNTAYGIIQSRLDYFICPNSFLYQLKNCEIQNSLYSDHNPVTLDLYIENETSRGKGNWKFNSSLLKDKEYVTKIKNKIIEYDDRYKNVKDHCLIWDTAKAEIRGISISHATYTNRQRNKLLAQLNIDLTNQERILAENPNENTLQQLATIKNEIEEINNHITKGIMIRAKAKFIEQNEANSKLFLGLERSRAKTKNISKLILDNNNSINDPQKILEEEKAYYQKLYQEKINYQDTESMEAAKYFLDHQENQITENDKNMLDANITDDEIATALKELP
jgi:hypothetical protein